MPLPGVESAGVETDRQVSDDPRAPSGGSGELLVREPLHPAVEREPLRVGVRVAPDRGRGRISVRLGPGPPIGPVLLAERGEGRPTLQRRALRRLVYAQPLARAAGQRSTGPPDRLERGALELQDGATVDLAHAVEPLAPRSEWRDRLRHRIHAGHRRHANQERVPKTARAGEVGARLGRRPRIRGAHGTDDQRP